MEEKINKIEFKDKLKDLYNKNKLKIYTVCLIIVIGAIILIFFTISNNKKNHVAAEKYVQAGLYLASEKKNEARKLYEEIILSENKIYSVLSLNTILEKNLSSDKQQILSYFEILEKLNLSDETHDIISFKKALYLIKSGDLINGNELLKKLIEKNSNLKSIAEELYKN